VRQIPGLDPEVQERGHLTDHHFRIRQVSGSFFFLSLNVYRF
jgi:hypothetical protein